ncbi:MAG: hypothetical protein J5I28_08635 [Acidimicrobiales bacterium]|nr:hypothetical protein [Acidimicrobiales bacterium]HLV89595.1 hypothetical protein [Acidimicrobiia bacterium]
MSEAPETIVCVECLGQARLMTRIPEDETMEPGTPLVYHCPDCYGRFDVIWEPE